MSAGVEGPVGERASLHSRYPSACQTLAVDFAPYTDALTATKLNRH